MTNKRSSNQELSSSLSRQQGVKSQAGGISNEAREGHKKWQIALFGSTKTNYEEAAERLEKARIKQSEPMQSAQPLMGAASTERQREHPRTSLGNRKSLESYINWHTENQVRVNAKNLNAVEILRRLKQRIKG